ncbi:MAG: ABC transporter permease [Desulfarculales bacterium]|jgi:lipopolysaccharide transport system permease protein|nr:ABC transporter permease [Desulfarculales bacterium]
MNLPEKWLWYRDLLWALLNKELTVRYKGSVLGFVWSVLNPLAQAMVFYVVFGVYMRFSVPHYLVALLAALFPWQWFVNCVNEGPHVFSTNPTLVKKVAFPRQAIPLVMILQHMVHFCIALPIYAAFMAADGLTPGLIWIGGVPLLLLLTLATLYGLCLFLGSLNIFLKDIGNLTTIVTQMAFFATPIMYTLGQVPENYYWCFKLNPVAPLSICWRSLLLDNAVNGEFLPYALLYALIFCLFGGLAFKKLHRRFAEVM